MPVNVTENVLAIFCQVIMRYWTETCEIAGLFLIRSIWDLSRSLCFSPLFITQNLISLKEEGQMCIWREASSANFPFSRSRGWGNGNDMWILECVCVCVCMDCMSFTLSHMQCSLMVSWSSSKHFINRVPPKSVTLWPRPLSLQHKACVMHDKYKVLSWNSRWRRLIDP